MGNGGSANPERKICAGAIIHSIFIHFVIKMIRRARQNVGEFTQTHEKRMRWRKRSDGANMVLGAAYLHCVQPSGGLQNEDEEPIKVP